MYSCARAIFFRCSIDFDYTKELKQKEARKLKHDAGLRGNHEKSSLFACRDCGDLGFMGMEKNK